MDINVTSYCDNFPLNIGNFYENFSCSEEINIITQKLVIVMQIVTIALKYQQQYPLFSTFLLSKFSD